MLEHTRIRAIIGYLFYLLLIIAFDSFTALSNILSHIFQINDKPLEAERWLKIKTKKTTLQAGI